MKHAHTFEDEKRPRMFRIGVSAIIGAGVLGFIVVLLFSAFSRNNAQSVSHIDPSASPFQSLPASAQAQAQESIFVYVTGAVHAPGVFSLASGQRVKDALEQAGGVLPSARLDQINLARILEDQEHIHVLDLVEDSAEVPPEARGSASSQGSGHSTKININTATLQELESLPGIGPALAGRIVQWRKDNGSFQSSEDLQEVSGIGQKLFSDIRERITI